jgi:hypothetical protein
MNTKEIIIWLNDSTNSQYINTGALVFGFCVIVLLGYLTIRRKGS